MQQKQQNLKIHRVAFVQQHEKKRNKKWSFFYKQKNKRKNVDLDIEIEAQPQQ